MLLQCNLTLIPLFAKEALVVPDDQLGFDLLDGLENNAHDNDEGRAAEGNVGSEHTIKDERDDAHDHKTDRSDEDDIVQDVRQIIRSRFARTDTGDKAALLLDIVCHFQRIEGDGSVEISKEHAKYNIEDQAPAVLQLSRITPVVGRKTSQDL